MGKGRFFLGRVIHIYLRISRNLGDEIFPKGVGVVTPKILFGFFKTFSCFEGSDLNFSSKEPPSQKISFMASVLFGFTQDLFLVLEVLAFYFWTQAKMLFTWDKCLLKISLKILYSFWNNPLPLSTNPSWHDLSANPLS